MEICLDNPLSISILLLDVSRDDHCRDMSRQPPVYPHLTAGCTVTVDLPGPNTGRHPDTSTPCTGHKRTPNKEGNKHLLFDRCVPKQSKSSLSTSIAELVVSRLLVVTANARDLSLCDRLYIYCGA